MAFQGLDHLDPIAVEQPVFVQVVFQRIVAHEQAEIVDFRLDRMAFAALPDPGPSTDHAQVGMMPEIEVGMDFRFGDREAEILGFGQRFMADRRVLVGVKIVVLGPSHAEAGIAREMKRKFGVVGHDRSPAGKRITKARRATGSARG